VAVLLFAMAVIMSMIVVCMVVVVVIVVLAHASVPLEGSAICSSISLSTPLIWASAAE
jgi:cytochrome c oxidase assembly protein Cox11